MDSWWINYALMAQLAEGTLIGLESPPSATEYVVRVDADTLGPDVIHSQLTEAEVPVPHGESTIALIKDELRSTLERLHSLRGEVWVLFWEATNLRARIFDTEDLSITRGGSTMADVFTRSASLALCPEGVVVVYAAASQVLAASGSKEAVEEFGQALQERFVKDPWRVWRRRTLAIELRSPRIVKVQRQTSRPAI